MNIFTGIADVFSGDVHVPPGSTLADQVAKAKADGLALVIAKATDGGLKVPPPFVDHKFRAWSDACFANAVEFGAYHFMRNTDTGISQAKFFYETIEKIGRDPKKIFAALDFEPQPHHDGSMSTPPDPSIANEFVIEWQRITGHLPWIYCDQSRAGVLAARSDIFKACRLWLAGYGIPAWPSSRLGPTILWQYLGAGATGGELPHDQVTYPISFKGLGKVDRSAFRGTADELLSLVRVAA